MPIMGPFTLVPTGAINFLQSTGVKGDLVMGPINLNQSGVFTGTLLPSVSNLMTTGFTMTGSINFYPLGTLIGTCTINLPTGSMAIPGTRYSISDVMATLVVPSAMVLVSAPTGYKIDNQTGFLLTNASTTLDIMSVATFTWKIV